MITIASLLCVAGVRLVIAAAIDRSFEGTCGDQGATGAPALLQMGRAGLSTSGQASPGSFEAARPGTCCNLQPQTEMLWSSFMVSNDLSPAAPVTVPCGHHVTIDENITGLAGLHVQGSLTFRDGVDLVLETDHIFVCGRFSIGSETEPHRANVKIVLTGSSDVQVQTIRGLKNFGTAPFVTYGGDLYLRGEACNATSWTRLQENVEPTENVHRNIAQSGSSSSAVRRRRGNSGGQQLTDSKYSWKWDSLQTDYESNPWGVVQVGGLQYIGIVKVRDPRRLSTQPLSTAIVGITNASCAQGQMCGGSICPFTRESRSKWVTDFYFDCQGAVGSKVYLQLEGAEQRLHVGEMEVYLARNSNAEYDLILEQMPSSWMPGHEVVIMPSDYAADQAELATVVGEVAGGVKVRAGLQYTHRGCATPGCIIAAEVASLSRNIKITGRPGCDPTCGHFMIAHTETGLVCGVEFTRLGQTAVEGRYPLHLHLPGDAPDLLVKDNALHHNINRGLVLHGVSHMKVERNVCYKTKGHCFMLEDAAEQFNYIRYNLGAGMTPLNFGCGHGHDMTFTCPSRSDTAANAFWISNPNNYFEGNRGIASGGAFFFETRHVFGKVRREFPLEANKVGHNGKIKGSTPLAQFSGNVAHSSGTGFGMYPRVGLSSGGSNAMEDTMVWMSGVGINCRGRMPVKRAVLVMNSIAMGSSTSKAAVVTDSKFIARPNWGFWNKGTEYVSAPLSFKDKLGLTWDSNLRSSFSLDNFTINWVRCHGDYDATKLGSRFFGFFMGPSRQTQCPQKWDGLELV